ncbi:MAG: hypothetical protein K1Y02_11170 [Candidatus Hydrogenedentes bacterium]|nr:hypothetical protein [Candidatus Hydrogenedentota bacterium]
MVGWRIAALALVAVALGVAGIGCPAGKDSPPSILLRNVDLAVGDLALQSVGKELDADSSKVLLYFNVLTEGSKQDPDVILSSENLDFMEAPNSIQLTGDFTGNDLYVSDYFTDVVAIWRDYRDLNAKGFSSPQPDVLIEEEVCDPFEILVVDNRLYVSNTYGDCFEQGGKQPVDGYVSVYDNAGAIVEGGGDLPTIMFDVPHAQGIAVVNDTLYVAAYSFCCGFDTGSVYVFDNMTQRLADVQLPPKGGDPYAPSAVLSDDSFLNLPDLSPVRVDVFGNRLYVTTNEGILFVFDNADSLIDGQAPSAVIAPTTGTVGYAGDMKMLDNTLYVANDGGLDKAYDIGMTAFRPGLAIQSGQNALVSFSVSNSQIPWVSGFAAERDVLFAATGGFDCCNYMGDVHIFYDADTLSIPRPADFVLPALKDFVNPISIDTNDFVTSEPTP